MRELFLPLPLVSVECPDRAGAPRWFTGALHVPNQVVVPDAPLGCAGTLDEAVVVLPGPDGGQRAPAIRAEVCGIAGPRPFAVAVLWLDGSPAGAADVEPFDRSALAAAFDRHPGDGWNMLQAVGLMPPHPDGLRPVDRLAGPALAAAVPEAPGLSWLSSGAQFSGWLCHLVKRCHPNPRVGTSPQL